MKKAILLTLLILTAMGTWAQSCYWVMLRDKAGTTFDPYSYFDSKAIERYQHCGADLNDISNYPLNDSYVQQINAIVSDGHAGTELFGQSRWLNAVAVMATDNQIALIRELPFVKQVDLIADEMTVCSQHHGSTVTTTTAEPDDATLTNQLLRMQGDLFKAHGYDGKNIRVAVFDGGFHAVNTHKAFSHLRDRNAIIATWDFTKKQENVYDNHTHGTMVLSCIAGVIDGRQLGLATGATFLLAKTEVDPEPFKEEVWWAQAMEWADKNGADIINSSLGYGKDRHYTYEMDGRSYVAKAANMAARKGMLVCNSAGNEGDDNRWKTIITPSDADSVLCVGGIISSLTSYKHIPFSSYGPSADGRKKPNIVTFGHAEVADPHNDEKTTFAYGTSFASPLAAGFAACALQAVRDQKLNINNMQLLHLIEASGDLYPYHDYAMGYGVPQASYFIDYPKNKNLRDEQTPAFVFEEIPALSDFVIIAPKVARKFYVDNSRPNINSLNNTVDNVKEPLFVKVENNDGEIEEFVHLETEQFKANSRLAIPKASLCGKKLTVHYGGTTQSYTLPKSDNLRYATVAQAFTYHYVDTAGYVLSGMEEHLDRTPADNRVASWGVGQKWYAHGFYSYGIPWFFGRSPMQYSDSWQIGFRVMRNFKKWYSLGLSLSAHVDIFRYDEAMANQWDAVVTPTVTTFGDVDNKELVASSVILELYQRIRFMPGGSVTHKGLYWDLGIYGSLDYHSYEVRYNENHLVGVRGANVNYHDIAPLDNRFSMGVGTRLGWDFVALYGRYRLSQSYLDWPRLEMGVEFSF